MLQPEIMGQLGGEEYIADLARQYVDTSEGVGPVPSKQVQTWSVVGIIALGYNDLNRVGQCKIGHGKILSSLEQNLIIEWQMQEKKE